jgi:ribosomal protein S28E/S33
MNQPTRQQVIDIVGRLGDDKLAQIIATGATGAEIMEAQTWLGEDDYMGRELHRGVSGRVAAVFEILKAVEPELEEREP